jgi:hypothetical protein
MTNYYTRFPNSLLQNPHFLKSPIIYRYIYLIIIHLAARNPMEINNKGKKIKLMPLQLYYGERELEKICGSEVSRNCIRGFKRYYEKHGFISIEVTHQKDLITHTYADTCDLILREGHPVNALSHPVPEQKFTHTFTHVMNNVKDCGSNGYSSYEQSGHPHIHPVLEQKFTRHINENEASTQTDIPRDVCEESIVHNSRHPQNTNLASSSYEHSSSSPAFPNKFEEESLPSDAEQQQVKDYAYCLNFAFLLPDNPKLKKCTLTRWMNVNKYPLCDIVNALDYYLVMETKCPRKRKESYVESTLKNRYWEKLEK